MQRKTSTCNTDCLHGYCYELTKKAAKFDIEALNGKKCKKQREIEFFVDYNYFKDLCKRGKKLLWKELIEVFQAYIRVLITISDFLFRLVLRSNEALRFKMLRYKEWEALLRFLVSKSV